MVKQDEFSVYTLILTKHCQYYVCDEVLKIIINVSGVKYIVTVVTGDKFGAGTDADVYLQLFGDLGNHYLMISTVQ